MGLVEDFISRYRREMDYYDEASRLCARQLDTSVQAAGIRGMVTYRAKNPTKLEDKIRQRLPATQYQTLDQISSDIVDLAGVRLALYFPGDRSEIDRLIRTSFDLIEEPKVFPVAGAPKHAPRPILV